MNLEIINPFSEKKWNNEIDNFAKASIFYSRNWARVLAESYGYEPAFFLSRVGRKIEFFLPVMEVNSQLTGRRGIALPFTDFCAPLAANNPLFEQAFYSIAEYARRKKWKYLELRGGEQFLSSQPSSLTYFNHRLNLSDENQMFKNLSQGHRRNIKKALKNNLEIRFEISRASIEHFYRLNCLTRKKHGLPPQPKSFFHNFFKYLVAEGFATIVTARHREKIVAAAIFLHSYDKIIYKYGASHPKFLDLRANHLVMWETIKYFSEKNYHIFEFGKTEISNQGLRRFKLGFGAEEEKINYYKFLPDKNEFITEENPESGWYTSIFRALPIPVLKLIGRILYRHVA